MEDKYIKLNVILTFKKAGQVVMDMYLPEYAFQSEGHARGYFLDHVILDTAGIVKVSLMDKVTNKIIKISFAD